MTVDLIFTCHYAKDQATGAVLWFEQETVDPTTGIAKRERVRVCKNESSWRAKGELVAPDRIECRKGGHCPDCGGLGTAAYEDKYAGATVFVYDEER